MQDGEFVVKWIRTGSICGLLAVGAYVGAIFVPLPDILGYALAFAFGPLLAIGTIGLYYGLSIERPGPLVQIAAFFGASAGVTVLIMLTTQQAIFGLMKRAIAEAGDPAAADVYRKIADSLNSVHLGIDIAWDVLISVAVILFGVAMLRHSQFGKIQGGLGIVIGGLLLGFNLWYFPTPPAAANSIDWGPFVALWFVAAAVRMLRAEKWARERLSGQVEAK